MGLAGVLVMDDTLGFGRGIHRDDILFFFFYGFSACSPRRMTLLFY